MKTLDMRGSPCPIPVITTKKELQNPDVNGVLVLVDNKPAAQNLQKMAHGYGYTCSSMPAGEDFQVTIEKGDAGTHPENMITTPPAAINRLESEGATVLVTKDKMGSGSDELGKILIKGYLFSLTELPVLPKAVIFLNSGVRLACAGSNTVTDLQALAGKGTEILACGTCLNYYSLTEQLAVGQITDMFGISARLAAAAKVISI